MPDASRWANSPKSFPLEWWDGPLEERPWYLCPVSRSNSAALRQRLVRGGLVACVLVAAAAARVATYDHVFTRDGVRFLPDTDPHYHVLRAERMLRGDPDGYWFDRNLSYPDGAIICWAPGFTGTIALSTRLLFGPAPSRADLERTAAVLPAVLGVVSVAVLLWTGVTWFGWAAGLAAGFLGAVLPLYADWGLLGRPDHHVAELVLFVLALFAFERSVTQDRSGPWLATLAGVLAMGPWMWHGSALIPGFLAAFVAATYLWRPAGAEVARRSARALAVTAAAGGAALAASMVPWHAPYVWHPASLNGLSAFAPAAILAVAAFSGLLVIADRCGAGRTGVRRAVVVALAAVAPLACLLLAFPGPVTHGLRAAVSGDPFLKTVGEQQPLLFSRIFPVRAELVNDFWSIGPILFAPFFAFPALRRQFQAFPSKRVAIALLGFGTALFFVLTCLLNRFRQYLAPFLVLDAGVLFAALLEAGSHGTADAFGAPRLPASVAEGRPWRRRALAMGLLLLLGFPGLHVLLADEVSVEPRLVKMLEWLRAANLPRRAVLSPWGFGHLLQYYGGAPVVVTPFGADLGLEGMRSLAFFLYAPDERSATAELERRNVGFVLLDDPIVAVQDSFPFAPADAQQLVVEEGGWPFGTHPTPLGRYEESIPAVLYYSDGVPPSGGRPSLGRFRLVYETGSGEGPPYKLFELVQGARLDVSGVPPATIVAVGAAVRTNQGRQFEWTTFGRADAQGRAVVVVPFASGRNGSSLAAPYVVRSGSRRAWVAVSEPAVTSGGTVSVDLAGGKSK